MGRNRTPFGRSMGWDALYGAGFGVAFGVIDYARSLPSGSWGFLLGWFASVIGNMVLFALLGALVGWLQRRYPGHFRAGKKRDSPPE
jgi:hypothetical protein